MTNAELSARDEHQLANVWPRIPKGFPLDGKQADTLDLIGSGPFDTLGFTTPYATLSSSALERNIARMATYCASRSVLLAPHAKTSMSPELFAMQVANGAWGITAATPWQAYLCRSFGIEHILLASQLVDPAALRWVAAEFGGSTRGRFLSLVDSAEQVALVDRALEGLRLERPLEVLLEVGHPGGRTGVRSDEQIDATVRAIQSSPNVTLVGVEAFEGLFGHDAQPATIDAVHDFLTRVRSVAERLDGTGAFEGVERVILTAGGSAYFDYVADILPGALPQHGENVDVILRSGGYIIHDDLMYAEVSPFTRRSELAADGELRQAASVWASVLSRPEPTLILLNAGKRDLPVDAALPRPWIVRRDGHDVGGGPAHGWEVFKTNDQHAYLRVPADANIRVGDVVGLHISHPCTFFDKWRSIPVVDDNGAVVNVVTTYF